MKDLINIVYVYKVGLCEFTNLDDAIKESNKNNEFIKTIVSENYSTLNIRAFKHDSGWVGYNVKPSFKGFKRFINKRGAYQLKSQRGYIYEVSQVLNEIERLLTI